MVLLARRWVRPPAPSPRSPKRGHFSDIFLPRPQKGARGAGLHAHLPGARPQPGAKEVGDPARHTPKSASARVSEHPRSMFGR